MPRYFALRSMVLALFAVNSIFWTTSAAQAQPFRHKFGELRSYERHWLAVCPEAGDTYANTCRGVTHAGVSGPFFDERLSVELDKSTGKHSIFIVVDNYETLDKTKPVSLLFSSGKRMSLKWGNDVEQNGNTVNEFVFTDPAKVEDIVSRMKAANHVTMAWPLSNGTADTVLYSTIGFTAAMDFAKKYAGQPTIR
ncbi:MAG: hypothetical protein AAGF28_09360 [Pseudomonadota bacterium]